MRRSLADRPPRRPTWARRAAQSAVLALALLLAATSAALACKEDVNNAAAYLAQLKRDAHKAKPGDRLRVLAWLKDAESTLNSARKDCSAAKNLADQALATAKVAAARASMAAADALIPAN